MLNTLRLFLAVAKVLERNSIKANPSNDEPIRKKVVILFDVNRLKIGLS